MEGQRQEEKNLPPDLSPLMSRELVGGIDSDSQLLQLNTATTSSLLRGLIPDSQQLISVCMITSHSICHLCLCSLCLLPNAEVSICINGSIITMVKTVLCFLL